MQSPPHIRDGDPQYPIPADTPIPPELRLPPPLVLNRPPPIPPMPENYKKTAIKDLEKKDTELKKSIISLERQLEKLNFEKAHIECCLDYFQMEQDDFMETVENYHTTSTPQSSPPSSPRSRSPMPPPVPPRPSFLQCMATSFLSAVPKDNSWSRCHNDICTYSFHYTCPGTGRANESDPPLPESFTLFNGRRTLSPALHIFPVLLIHQLHQENPGTLRQPTEANVYVMTASMAMVASGKYTSVLYSCYFGCICFPLIFELSL